MRAVSVSGAREDRMSTGSVTMVMSRRPSSAAVIFDGVAGPGVVADEEETAAGHVQTAEVVEQVGHAREEVKVVGRSGENDVAVFEAVADDVGVVCP